MSKVVITGVDGPLGWRVGRLAVRDRRGEVVGLADRPVTDLPEGVAGHQVALHRDDLEPHLQDASVVLHLAESVPATPTAPTGDVATVRHVLEAAGDAGVSHLVVLSSALAYGAWANNPVPLTEEAPLRPNPGVPFAAERAEIERQAAEWRDQHPSATVTVLRPVRAAGGPDDWLVRVLRPAAAVPDTTDEPPVQFVHLDDLASAVDLAWRAGLSGAFNVAPEGWIPGDRARSLIGVPPTVPVPERAARRLLRWGSRWGLGGPVPELVPYTLHPWVVASDRLRGHGWAPTVSNEEACVEAHEAGPWATLSPRRRQELALGLAGAGLAGATAVAALAARRWWRSSRAVVVGRRPGPGG